MACPKVKPTAKSGMGSSKQQQIHMYAVVRPGILQASAQNYVKKTPAFNDDWLISALLAKQITLKHQCNEDMVYLACLLCFPPSQ